MSFTTMSFYCDLWFIKQDGKECTCEEYYSEHATDRVMKLYAGKGLVLKHGMTISLIHCKKAMEIMHACGASRPSKAFDAQVQWIGASRCTPECTKLAAQKSIGDPSDILTVPWWLLRYTKNLAPSVGLPMLCIAIISLIRVAREGLGTLPYGKTLS